MDVERRVHERMERSVQKLVRQEGVLLLVCVCSDVLPKLLSSRLDLRGALWSAVIDNASHASIAAASWVVMVALSPSPGFLIARPGSPLHRCVSYPLIRLRRRRRRAILASKTSIPPRKGGDLKMTDQSLVPPSRGKAHATAADREGWLGATTREIIFTACCGSVLDFDHFLAAGSLKLSSATRLANRPWGHCMAAVVLAAFLVSTLTHNRRAAASVFSAGMSHQLRDATRRGLWLYPPRGPRTSPLGYPTYLMAQALLPLLVAWFLQWDAAAGGLSRDVQGTQQHYRGDAALEDAGSDVERGPSPLAV